MYVYVKSSTVLNAKLIIKNNFTRKYRPFPSYPLPLFQNESTCETIDMKMCSTFTSIFMKSFSFECVRKKTRFETEAKGNSKMAY